MEKFTINKFLGKEIKSCFVCGNKNYQRFFIEDHLYQVCTKCLRKDKVRLFFNDKIKVFTYG